MRQKNKKPKFKNPYKSENDLCNVLIEYAKDDGWKTYPETSRWDILLVKNGIQIGVQAKLKDNIEVLAQAIYEEDGFSPDIRAVLVPHASKYFKKVADGLRVFVIEGARLDWNFNITRSAEGNWVKEIITDLNRYNKKYLRESKNKCWVPEVEINTPAGIKSPKLITPWKIKAVKLCLKLNEVGFLTSKDFAEEKISITLWKKKWLIVNGKIGKSNKYIKKVGAILPDETYPEIVEAIKRNK